MPGARDRLLLVPASTDLVVKARVKGVAELLDSQCQIPIHNELFHLLIRKHFRSRLDIVDRANYRRGRLRRCIVAADRQQVYRISNSANG
jgi:hypothetical protein